MNADIDGRGDDKAKRRMALNIKIILLVLLGGAIALFLIQNVGVVEIQFLFWSVTMRRATLALLALGIGVIVGWVFRGIQIRGQRRRKDAVLPPTSPAEFDVDSPKSQLFDRDQ